MACKTMSFKSVFTKTYDDKKALQECIYEYSQKKTEFTDCTTKSSFDDGIRLGKYQLEVDLYVRRQFFLFDITTLLVTIQE